MHHYTYLLIADSPCSGSNPPIYFKKSIEL